MSTPMRRVIDLEIELDRNGPVPLYHQVARELERAIADGRLVRGDMLDNELLLADRWQVSRLTLRRSIQELVDQGLLVRRRGVGTQVVADRLPTPPQRGSLYDDLREQGRAPATTVLAHERVVADDDIADRLGLASGSTVVHIERCRYADARRIAILRDWLTVDAAGEIDTAALATSGLYDLLRSRGVWPHSSTRRIRARNANPVDAALLGLPVGAPLLAVESTMQDSSGIRVDVSEQLLDAASYTMELSVVEG